MGSIFVVSWQILLSLMFIFIADMYSDRCSEGNAYFNISRETSAVGKRGHFVSQNLNIRQRLIIKIIYHSSWTSIFIFLGMSNHFLIVPETLNVFHSAIYKCFINSILYLPVSTQLTNNRDKRLASQLK